MKRRNPIYYLCDKNDNKLIEFESYFSPRDHIITKAEILEPNLVPDFLKNGLLAENLYLYLRACRQDLNVHGLELDELIVKELNLSKKILNNGRLEGMEYLIDLLKYHYYNKDTEFYITPKEPCIISFLGTIYGWDRVFIDKPTKKGI